MKTTSRIAAVLSAGLSSLCPAGQKDPVPGTVAGVPPTAILKVVPVPAKVGSYPPGTTTVGNEISAFVGGFRAWFEFKISDWDPNGDNIPPLHLWQFGIDGSGFLGANADPPNPGVDLSPPAIACANNAPCVSALGEPWAECGPFGTCAPAYVDRIGTAGPDSWCADTGSGFCESADCDVSSPNLRCYSIYPASEVRPDEGIEYYGATLVLDVPNGAVGRYTVNLSPDNTFMGDNTVGQTNDIPTLSETGFVVNILPPSMQACCHSAGGCTDMDSVECVMADDTPQGESTICLGIQCPPPKGACCDRSTFSCMDQVLLADCPAPSEWTAGVGCADLPTPCLPTGACCDGSPGTGGICTGGLFQDECSGPLREWTQSQTCAGIVCEEARGPCCDLTTFACTDDVLQADCPAGPEVYWRGDSTCESCAPGPQMRLTPVPSKVGSYPPGTTIVGNELTALAGGFRAWFEFHVSHWDQDGDNVPPLEGWQFKIDRSGYQGESADPPNPGVDLTPPTIPCSNNDACVAAFGEAWARCEVGTCNPTYVDSSGTGRPDSWCADTGSGPCRYAACQIDPPATGCTSLYPTNVPRLDGGIDYYGATLVLDIPLAAKGRYTVNLKPFETFMFEATLVGDRIPTLSETGFVVNILTGACCFGLGTTDQGCTDGVAQAECGDDEPAPFAFTPQVRCPPEGPDCAATGACCDLDPFGSCVEGVLPSDCHCPNCTWHEGRSCGEIQCARSAIPTVSAWGLGTLGLLLMIAAKVAFGRRATPVNDAPQAPQP